MSGNGTTAAGDSSDQLVSLTPAILYTSLAMLMGACGNALVCYVYGFRWQRTVTKIFIFSLAVFDLLNSLICMPTELAMLVKIVSFDAPEWCKVTRFLTYTLNGSSSLILVAIAVDRFYKIHRPWSCFFTDGRAKGVCIGAVFLAAGLSWPSLIFYGNLTVPVAGSDAVGVMCLVSDDYIDTWWPMVFYSLYFTCYLALVVAVTVLYSLIAMRIVRLRRKQKERLKVGVLALRNSTSDMPPGGAAPMARIVIGDVEEKELIDDDKEIHARLEIKETDVIDEVEENDVSAQSHGNELTALRNQPRDSRVKSLGDILNHAAKATLAKTNSAVPATEENVRRRSVTFKLPCLAINTSDHQNGRQTSDGALNGEATAPKISEIQEAEQEISVDRTDRNSVKQKGPEQQQFTGTGMSERYSLKRSDRGSSVKKGQYQMTVLRLVCAEQPNLQDERKTLDPQNPDVGSEERDVKLDAERVNDESTSLLQGEVGDDQIRKAKDRQSNEAKDSISDDAETNGHCKNNSSSCKNVAEHEVDLDSKGTDLVGLLPPGHAQKQPESGMTSRNSFLMPPGGYPGGHTPTSRLPTPTDTPNPDSADNRPERLSSALLLDRLSKKMAYKPAKTTRMLFAISIVFVVSFLPFFVIVLMRAVQGRAFLASLSQTGVVLVNMFIRSSFISNAANPIIYGLCNKQFRVECRHLIGRFSGRQSDVTMRVMEQTDDALGCVTSN